MRIFKKELKITIIDYMNKKRIDSSLEELQDTKDSILKIALNHGFTSQEYYTEIFHKEMGVNPLTYRKFSLHHPSVSEEDSNQIRKNLTEIKYLLDQIENYKRNVPKETIKKLSRYH